MSTRIRIIGDTNVWIDLEEVPHFISKTFQLPYQFIVTDILYREELKGFSVNLVKKGLAPVSLNEKSMVCLKRLSGHKELSLFDRSLLALALQEKCQLLTGDQCLRNAAMRSEVEVKTTFWILGELARNKIISPEEKENAHKEMIIKGRLAPKMNTHQSRRFSARKTKH